MDNKIVRAGIAVILVNKSNQILLGKRIGKFNPGVYALPGGKPEYGENPEDTARREIKEETGLKIIGDLHQFGWVNNYFPQDGSHYITLFYIARSFEGELINMEPDKCESWNWYNLDNLPNPLWQALGNVLDRLNIII